MTEQSFPDMSRLTPAERAVLECLMAGRTNKEIGRILSKSEFTVKTQVQRMLEKTGAENRTQLSVLALRAVSLPKNVNGELAAVGRVEQHEEAIPQLGLPF